MAVLTGLISVDRERMDRPVPMKLFPRAESWERENLHAYNKVLISVLEALEYQCCWEYFQPMVLSTETGNYIRGTYLSIWDLRICKRSEYIRQVEDNPLSAICQVPYTFIIAAGESDRPYDHDKSEPLTVETDLIGDRDPEGDCTYLNIARVWKMESLRLFQVCSNKNLTKVQHRLHHKAWWWHTRKPSTSFSIHWGWATSSSLQPQNTRWPWVDDTFQKYNVRSWSFVLHVNRRAMQCNEVFTTDVARYDGHTLTVTPKPYFHNPHLLSLQPEHAHS